MGPSSASGAPLPPVADTPCARLPCGCPAHGGRVDLGESGGMCRPAVLQLLLGHRKRPSTTPRHRRAPKPTRQLVHHGAAASCCPPRWRPAVALLGPIGGPSLSCSARSNSAGGGSSRELVDRAMADRAFLADGEPGSEMGDSVRPLSPIEHTGGLVGRRPPPPPGAPPRPARRPSRRDGAPHRTIPPVAPAAAQRRPSGKGRHRRFRLLQTIRRQPPLGACGLEDGVCLAELLG